MEVNPVTMPIIESDINKICFDYFKIIEWTFNYF